MLQNISAFNTTYKAKVLANVRLMQRGNNFDNFIEIVAIQIEMKFNALFMIVKTFDT